MPASDPAEILLAHDRWATRQLIDAARELTHDQFHQRFEMGLGSVHDTLAHIVGVIAGWGDFHAGRPRREPWENSGPYTCDQLAAALDEFADEFAAHTTPHDEVVTAERHGRVWSFTRGAVLTHVTTHGVHHRAQCVNMLRHLGQEGPWRVSVVEWTLADASAP
ncbi:MAG: hypothetical protein H6810_06115 [Phycisphaeraceae bacterium]|nr:MAG: hypothetical protein H6810_06115 [Phycisphaeraceae bacterium]